MAWVEGITSSKNILFDLAEIMTKSNKDEDEVVIEDKNWSLVYPAETSDIGSYGKVVLKTTTTPVTLPIGAPVGFVTEKTMYLEIFKDEVVINPETGEVALSDTSESIKNHYYLKLRIFDECDEDSGSPTEAAHVSEWSKLSWYIDFKEVLNDSLDADPGISNINDGISFRFVETTGIYEDLPVHYWVSTNNDRTSLVLMGEPSINFNNYLTSFAYVGKIDSFEDGVSDVDGNFALNTSSSTIPCAPEVNPNKITEFVDFNVEGVNSELFQPTDYGTVEYQTPYKILTATAKAATKGIIKFRHKVSYRIVAFNSEGISNPTASKEIEYEHWYTSKDVTQSTFVQGTSIPISESLKTWYDKFKITINSVPDNITGIRIYRKDIKVKPTTDIEPDLNWILVSEQSIDDVGGSPEGFEDEDWEFIDSNSSQIDSIGNPNRIMPLSNFSVEDVGVVRDEITGAVIYAKTPTRWGDNTATGVTDISMYKTRAGVFYQKHLASFISPDEYMKKVTFNPSKWTNKFHLSPLYIVHPVDGYRGFLSDIAVVDDSSIIHLDDLVVNKGETDEHFYKYFKVSTPFSILSSSANSRYGIAIKKV